MRGMVSASARRSNTMPTRENMPGLRSPFGSLTSSVTLKVAVAASTVGATSFTIAGNVRPARASTAIDAACPGLSRASSRSGTYTAAFRGVGSVTRNMLKPIDDFLAELHVPLGHDAGERRADFTVREIQTRDVVGGALIVEIVFEAFECARRIPGPSRAVPPGD